MIALLDPALFVWGSQGAPLDPREEAHFERLVGDILRACSAASAELAPVAGYWDPLWRDFVSPLRGRLQTPGARAAVDELRKRGRGRSAWPAAPPETRVWGFRNLFGQTPLMPHDWEDRMAEAATRVIVGREAVMMMVRLVEGRNLHIHRGKKHVVIGEVTRWRLYVLPPSAPAHVPIDCVRSAMQIRRRWTIRYDPRLPTQHDRVRYPFCLPRQWHRRSTNAVDTMKSVPVWLDDAGRGWTRPDIPEGSGYHWDVFLTEPTLVTDIGVDQLNIVEFGAPSSEGTAGSLHHVPEKKKSKVKDLGWGCP